MMQIILAEERNSQTYETGRPIYHYTTKWSDPGKLGRTQIDKESKCDRTLYARRGTAVPDEDGSQGISVGGAKDRLLPALMNIDVRYRESARLSPQYQYVTEQMVQLLEPYRQFVQQTDGKWTEFEFARWLQLHDGFTLKSGDKI